MTEEFSKAYWEGHYHGHGAGHRTPNPHLVAEAAELTPGTALDAGCGEGAEAIWLAAQGWQVTAVDIADGALRNARAHAQAAGDPVAARIDWLQADLSDWAPPVERFDLVCSLYVHPTTSRESLADRLAAAVAPGGTLLIVGHHPSDPRPVSHAAARDVHFTAADVAAGLDPDRWEILVAEDRHRPITGDDGHHSHHGQDGHDGHDSHRHSLHDTVVRARKLPHNA
ncbi:class I SAM-dependent methyltransferase [Catellatospora sichuanensis]|uniref:class I SAM-dependent methyltransferase n=1 Tax=Catellatospora sichuanensis TaxID=1969805 RepID=UPI0011827601|nr:class I SAM-dependent methyltransferase [Catellatospora sichuanensis]